MRKFERLVRHVRKRYRSFKQPRRGADVCADLASIMKPRTIFDVGANIGQSAVKFRRRFPEAQIHCFEPSASNADRIRTRSIKNVEVHQVALGSTAATAMLSQGADPATFHISENGDAQIRIETIDAFCAENGIERIDFLKIDTEGHDLEVLKGAVAMLDAGRVVAVQVEAGMNPENTFHIPFEALKAFLEDHGYRLFGFYDQVTEWPTKQPHLRRANPMFVSHEIFSKAR
ncbi:FkbM family methyltransferase [Sphingomonas sp. HMP9]|uniref:FkbM family methyltransferase n=1 Tax=Sphingomonas sp. HMP9 TaxID=1517554 RepID=UPI001596408D|nr:FkbM family methyltransferase [Sphingomonas sp. HMP9]